MDSQDERLFVKHPSLSLAPEARQDLYCGLVTVIANDEKGSPQSDVVQMLHANDKLMSSISRHQTSGPLHKQLTAFFELMANEAKKRAANVPKSKPVHVESLQVKPPDCLKNAQTLMGTVLATLHAEANSVNHKMENPCFKPTCANSAINYQLEYIDNSYLATLLLHQVETLRSCATCKHVTTTWATNWVLSLDVPSTENCTDFYNLELPSVGSCLKKWSMSKASNASCVKCATSFEHNVTCSLTRTGHLLLIHLHRPDQSTLIFIEESIRFCGRPYMLSSAIYDENYGNLSGKSIRKGILVRQSSTAWIKLAEDVTTMVRNDAKKLLDEAGNILLYEEIIGHGLVAMDSTESNIDSNSDEKDYCGLENLGNTSYANSCLQMLYTVLPIRQYFIEHQLSGPFHQSLAGLFKEMEDKVSQLVVSSSPEDFMAQFCSVKTAFAINKPADAQQFLEILVDILHQEANEVKKKVKSKPEAEPKIAVDAWNWHVKHYDNSFLSELFMGQVESILACQACQNSIHRSWACIWQLQLSLDGYLEEESKQLLLEECIREYQTSKQAGAVLSYCSQCKTHRHLSKKTTICRWASYLVVHLMRFTGKGTKFQQQVKIQEQLELAGLLYQLTSAILYKGSDQYYLIHRQAEKKWAKLDDEDIATDQSNDWAFEQMQKAAYVCLYQVIDKEKHETVKKANFEENKKGAGASSVGSIVR